MGRYEIWGSWDYYRDYCKFLGRKQYHLEYNDSGDLKWKDDFEEILNEFPNSSDWSKLHKYLKGVYERDQKIQLILDDNNK